MVVASLFGVGAPEVLVIGVVALLVFGPKGLAEVLLNKPVSLFSYSNQRVSVLLIISFTCSFLP